MLATKSKLCRACRTLVRSRFPCLMNDSTPPPDSTYGRDPSGAAPVPASLVPGLRMFGRYVLEARVGRSEGGVVWRAKDEVLPNRTVALKFLPDAVAADPAAVSAMRLETSRSLELSHQHVVRVLDFLTEGGRAAVLMEFVDGQTLDILRNEQPNRHFEVADLRRWVRQLIQVLHYAHRRKLVIHRGLEPAHLMVDADGDIKVPVFGAPERGGHTHPAAGGLTDNEERLVYLSPQRIRGEKPAIADDIYTLGVTLYDLLAGRPPLYGGKLEDQILNRVPLSITDRRVQLEVAGDPVPAAWEDTIAACLAKSPADRPASARVVLEALSARAPSPAPVAAPVSPPPASSVRAVPVSEPPPVPSEAPPSVPPPKIVSRPARVAVASPEVPPPLPPASTPRASRAAGPAEKKKKKASSAPALVTLLVLLAVAGLAGWWFGIEQPKREAAEVARRAEVARLANARGGLIVATAPAGAAVSVAGAGESTSPARFEDLRLGDYEVTLTLAGYETRKLSLTVEADRFTEPTAIELVPTRGAAQINSEPAGIDFALESTELVARGRAVERRTGRTPVAVADLPVGDYVATFTRPDWSPVRQNFVVEANRTTTVTPSFTSGGLTLASQPDGVSWQVAGGGGFSDSGDTPAELTLPPGAYTVTMSRPGWPDFVRDVTVIVGNPVQVNGDFRPASVLVTSVPAGAEVLAGVKIMGTTPLRLTDTRPGPKRFQLQAPGFTGIEVSGEAVAGEELHLEGTLAPLAIALPDDLGLQMLPVAAGRFTMGSPDNEPGRADNEVPHEVTISRPFWIGRTEITMGQWNTIMGTDVLEQVRRAIDDNDEHWLGGKRQTYRAFKNVAIGADPRVQIGQIEDDRPMILVNYAEVLEFCERLTERERAAGRLPAGYVYSLPTEAQWEYACRAGTTSALYNGAISIDGLHNAPALDPISWYGGNSSVDYTGRGWNTDNWADKQFPGGLAGYRTVATKRANPWQVHDMLGNVWEWCRDVYGTYSAGAVTDPTGPTTGEYWIMRGGGWTSYARAVRAAYRNWNTAGVRRDDLGFRVALVPAQP